MHAGRPLRASGAHVLNHNSHTLGVCCEGDYDAETAMPEAQLRALRAAIAYLKDLYPGAAVRCHRDYMATACPGKHFPLDAVLQSEKAAGTGTTHPTGDTGDGGRMVSAPASHNEKEEPEMQRYNTVGELPEAYRADVQVLVDRGFLKGKGDASALALTEDMARVLVICARMEGVV